MPSVLDRILAGEIRVRCNACGLEGLPRLEDVPTEAGGAVRTMYCHHCKAAQPVAIISPYGMRLMDEIQEAAAKRDSRLVQKLQKKMVKEVRRP